ncbi:glycosyltransferase [Paenibacillus rhizoplanae]|uniref:glycosyltransferase n=1 Tax=Paenibacillus rhizoplanae TaxID=1917181 RepID=UPI00360CBD14
MRVLWLTNIAIPEASSLMNDDILPLGGWLVNTSKDLSVQEDLTLSIAFPYKKNRNQKLQGEKIIYYSFPAIKNEYDSDNLLEIINEFKPDIVHVFGTEFTHSLTMINICNEKNIKSIISIQGLVSIIAQHYLMGLPAKVKYGFTLRDFIKRDSVLQQKKKFAMRGKHEIKALKKAENVIGRTSWDKACTTQIHPDINYYFCNESLREEFYKHTWEYENCEIHSIFVSQASYPIKGLHIILQALPIVLRKYPEAKLYIAGADITKSDTLFQKMKISTYGAYIKSLIKKHELEDNVFFTGYLNEREMCNRFLKSNVFVSASIIENESNSLSEANYWEFLLFPPM